MNTNTEIPTKEEFISDFTENEYVQTSFLAAKKELRTTKNGDPYISATLTDRTGQIEARVWDNVDAIANRFSQGDVVQVQASVSSYRDELQLKIIDLSVLPRNEVDLGDYLPASRWPRDAMFERLQKLLDRQLEDPEVRRFVTELFDLDDIVDSFKTAPAATRNHHNYVGGLLEHTLSMCRLATSIVRHYDNYYPGLVDGDLVLTGCLLHDLGKVVELSQDSVFDYSDDGKLVGHIVEGVEILNRVNHRSQDSFSDELIRELKHLIVSHHGHREYGSPVEPKMAEALLLHQIDMIDSQMNMCGSIADDHESNAENVWANHGFPIGNEMYISPRRTGAAPRSAADPETGPGSESSHPAAAAESKADPDGEQSERDDSDNLKLFDSQ